VKNCGEKMLDQNSNDKIIHLRRMAAEYFQKAAWNQLLALDNYRENNYEAADRFAQLSFDDQMNAVEYAEMADAESEFLIELKMED
jgi:DNA-binding SARP family transcriptional activator